MPYYNYQGRRYCTFVVMSQFGVLEINYVLVSFTVSVCKSGCVQTLCVLSMASQCTLGPLVIGGCPIRLDSPHKGTK